MSMTPETQEPRFELGIGPLLKGNVATTKKLLDDLADSRMAAMGLSVGEADVLTLLLLTKADPPAPTMLAEWLGLTTAGITGRLNTLERKRFIERRPHATDGRRVTVHMTETGAARASDVVVAKDEAWSEVVVGILGEAATEDLNATLQRLNDALWEAVDPSDGS